MGEWQRGATGVDPITPLEVDLRLPDEALRVLPPTERLAVLATERIAVASPVVTPALLDVTHFEPPVLLGAGWERTRGFWGSLAVCPGHYRSNQKQPLTCCFSRSRVRGGAGNRTRVEGFAGPCLNHSATPPIA